MRSRARDDAGSATTEFAVVLPAVLALLAVLLGGVRVAADHLRAQDAAADAARGLARGDTRGAVTARLEASLPGAQLAVAVEDDLLCVRVEAPPVVLGLRASARSCALAGGR